MPDQVSALGEAAERAVSTISTLAADAAPVPSRLGDVARLLTAEGKLGTVWQFTLPFVSLLLGSIAIALVVSRPWGLSERRSPHSGLQGHMPDATIRRVSRDIETIAESRAA